MKPTVSGPARRRPGKKSQAAAVHPSTDMAPAEARTREQKIAEGAYFRAEQRNFEAGRELDDWLAAELEIDSLRPQRQESIDDANLISPIP